MKTIRKIASIFVVSVLCLAARPAWAENYGLTHSSGDRTIVLATTAGNQFSVDGEGSYDCLGNINVSGGTLNIVFNTTDCVYLAGRFNVTHGTLSLSLGTNYTARYATLKRATSYSGEFFFVNNSTTTVSDCNLIVQGESDKDFIIDGGCKGFTIVQDANSNNYNVQYSANGSVLAQSALVISVGGTIDFDYVAMRNNYNVYGGHDKDGGAMNVRQGMNSSESTSHQVITMDYCKIDSCYAQSCGSAIRVRVNNDASVPVSMLTMNHCEVSYCYSYGEGSSMGGLIRTWGASRCGLELNNCTVRNNYNFGAGSTQIGLIHWNAFDADTLRLNHCVIDSNWNRGDGGGVYISSLAKIIGTQITNNRSEHNGGGLCYTPYSRNSYLATLQVFDPVIDLDSTTVIEGNTAAGNGGGIWFRIKDIKNGSTTVVYNANNDTISVSLKVNGATIRDNHAQNGGGVYITRTTEVYHANIDLNYGEVVSNTAEVDGGGIFANGGVVVNVGLPGDSVDAMNVVNNEAVSGSGGGLFVDNGAMHVNDCYISGNTAVYGGGICLNNGLIDYNGGFVFSNVAHNNGGGVYISSGSFSMKDGIIGGADDSYSNMAICGGGIYTSGGVIAIQGGKILHNMAQEGGGLYSNDDDAEVYVTKNDSVSQIRYNIASKGGGIYSKKGFVEFSDGDISFNFAMEEGGGLYVDDEGMLLLKGSALLNRNYVPRGQFGGGVFLKGRLIVGDNMLTVNTIVAKDNFAADTDTPETYVITNDTRNNVYLPDPDATFSSALHPDVITIVENGIDATSRVGFSVPRNLVPVIYCAPSTSSWGYLDNFTTGPDHPYQDVLFDDTDRYLSVHRSDWPSVFDPDHVYLYGFWPEAVVVEPEGFSFDNIDSREDLAWLITCVNGRKDVEGLPDLPPHSLMDTVIYLNADLDMSEFGWVPIGISNPDTDEQAPFKGIFNGNGHTIQGIISMAYKTHYGYGFFGNVEEGVVQDMFLEDALFNIENNDDLFVGALVAEMESGAVLRNCEASARLNVQSPGMIVGGAVGRMGLDGNSTTLIHSICAMPDIEGGKMGGIVGQIVSGSLYNSFANPKFNFIGTGQYFGGLVGENSGGIANCYVRLRGTVPTATSFGWFVGQHNENADLQYCYSREGSVRYVANKNPRSIFTNYRYYDNNAETPYLYLRRDVQVHVVEGNSTYIPVEPSPDPYPEVDEDKQMLLCLNNWVNDMNGSYSIYTSWMRPTTTAINGDYPILRMPSTDAVACSGTANGGESEFFLHYAQINDLIAAYPAQADTAAICLYQSNDNVDGNAHSGAKLYIDEKVSLIQNDTLNAYVGVTLDNSAGANGANPTYGGDMIDYIDWHMFSTPLANAPLAVKYVKSDGTEDTTQYLFSYGHSSSASGDPMPYYQFYDESERDGYFPSHVYGTIYVSNDNTTPMGVNHENYYQDWDYYTYSEADHHWVNFKRNSQSHWHEDDTLVPIPYQNEEMLVVGKGYLLATRQPTYLQCYGVLNGNEPQLSIPVAFHNNVRPGYNLLGNPYLAYLDFDKFAWKNSSAFWDCDTTSWFYTVLDEDPYVDADTTYPGGYKYYAYHSSVNPYGAPRYIAPHQGFMIQLACESDDTTAVFTPDMRDIYGDGGHFRDAEQPAYPLVNLFATDATGNRDMTTVELGRPDQGGALMMRDLRLATCHVWCRYEDRDWAIAFTKPGMAEVPIRFEAYENGEYTMTWNTQNGNFSYLHLIDNMTGVDVDCLTEREYRFVASTSDYRSRFRLLFGYTGIDDHQTEGDQQVTNFAFQSGDELVVNGEGTLQMFDVTGRKVMSKEIQGMQTATALPDVSVGVYLLRLDTVNGTKVQKIVIK